VDHEGETVTELRVPRPGDRIGDYTVERELGRGAVSIVVLACERRGDGRVALRLINQHTYWTTDEAGRASLEARVRAVASLAHPNLVRVHGCGRWCGWTFVAMEYIEGRSLGDWLVEHEHDPDWRRTTALFIGVAEGLAAAHDRGLLHCDLDPGAVLVAFGGDAKLRGLDVGEPPAGVNAQLFGAWRTTSPERILGQAFDHRSDQFALCALLWYALASASGPSRRRPCSPSFGAS
jgi:serine/threonine protein kinase